MTEETTTAPEAATEAPNEPKFTVQRIYLKDLSYETPQGAEGFQKQWQPKVNQDLNTSTSKIEEGLFEVALRVTITVTDGDDTIYLVEVEQAGLFTATGFSDQQLAQVLNTTCPSMLFPYAREVIDNVLVKGCFPPLMIPPINFDALFASAVQRAQADAAKESETSDDTTH